MATPRNAPCPCGSGKKFKHCHLGKEAELAPAEDGFEAEVLAPKSKPWWMLSIPVVLGVGMGLWKGSEMGFYVGVAALMAVGGFIVFRDPPPPRNQGNASGIGFGN